MSTPSSSVPFLKVQKRCYHLGHITDVTAKKVPLCGHLCVRHHCWAVEALRLLKTQSLHLSEHGVFLAFCRFEDAGCQASLPMKLLKIKPKNLYQHVRQLSTIPSVFPDKTRLASRLKNFCKAWTILVNVSKKKKKKCVKSKLDQIRRF